MNISTDSTTLDQLIDHQTKFIPRILDILQLDNSPQSEKIAEELISKGRQILAEYEDRIGPDIFQRQINDDSSKLFELLKTYWEQRWQLLTEEWFRIFLSEQRTTATELYEQILSRNVQWGSKFLKDNPILSLVIQFLFEFNEDEIENSTLFDDIWQRLITEGRQGIHHYSDNISSIVLKAQLEDRQSPLYLALNNYFHHRFIDIFKQKDVNITKLDVMKIVLDRVVDSGWQKGLDDEIVRNSIAAKRLTVLKEKCNLFFQTSPPATSNNDRIDVSSDSSSSFDSLLSSPINEFETSTLRRSIDIPPSITENNHEQEQRRKQEIDLISKCIKQNDKLHPAYLIEAGELIYTDKKFHVIINAIIGLFVSEKNFPLFIDRCLITIMYLLKRNQTLEEFFDRLSSQYNQNQSLAKKYPKLSLRMFIHILLLNSNFPLSRMVISLLSKRNPVPFLEPSILNTSSPSSTFVCDLIHVWDDSKPVILSFGIGKCSGKSTLLNTLFQSTFEQSKSSIYFHETIDIDFGYNFIPPRPINFADTHGIMTNQLLTRIRYLFEAFIIQVEYKYLKENMSNVKRMIDIVSKAEIKFLIVRDVPAADKANFSENLTRRFLLDPSIECFTLPNVVDKTCAENRQLLQKLQENLLEKMPRKSSKTPAEIRQQLQTFTDIKYRQYTDQIYRTVDPLKQQLIQAAKEKSDTMKYFPDYAQFVELCRLQSELNRFNFFGHHRADANVFELRRRIYELQNTPRNAQTNPGSISHLFNRLSEAPNMLICLEYLGNELKKERTQLISKRAQDDQLPIERCLNLEVLWRNAIVCSIYQSYEIKQNLYKRYYDYIASGFPFEIIDGENFYYQEQFLYQTLKLFPGKKILVISVIGPHNSGKSTLLNYMFGTIFDVRDGRCTRGVFGSFVKSNRPDFDYILLIDTEGLLSIERTDLEYDRRIVLFCLAVSHVVIVNINGELTTTVQDMLTLCTDSLTNMDVTRIPKPVIHFILNRKLDLDRENNQTAIDRILADFRKFQLNQAIDIREETFHRLPSAFQTERSNFCSSPKFIKTDLEFLEHTQLICGKILRSIQTSIFSHPLHWLKTSKTIFDTLQKFADLTYYRDINDRRTDNDVRKHIENSLRNLFTLDYRERLIADSLQRTEEEIKQFFLVESTKIQRRAEEDIEDILGPLEASDAIRTRSREFLQTQIIEMFNALQATSIAMNEREKIKSLVRNGTGDLQTLIDTIIHNATPMSTDKACEQFNRLYNNTVIHIKSKFVCEERLKQALNYIYANYNIYEKESLPAYQHIVPHLSILMDINQQNISIPDAKEKFILKFTNQAYQHCPVSALHDNLMEQTPYSMEMIEGLVYLNKSLLKQEFVKLNANRHGLDQFQIKIRNVIQEQKPRNLIPSRIDDENMFFRISQVIRSIMQRILIQMQDDPKHEVRQIQTELIQTFVGIITSYITDINAELAPFCLALSRPFKSILHLFIVILLTEYHYNEQSNHFKQALINLQENQSHLKNYFISMVSTNTSSDTNYANNFLRQLYEHLCDRLKSQAQHTIDEQLDQHEDINRRSMQELCDHRLTSHDDIQWNMDYMENPTKMIEEMFEEKWSIIKQSIDQSLVDLKLSWRNIFIEFFFCIQGIVDAVRNLAPSVRLIDSIFQIEQENSLGADENLINKKQCLARLLEAYFTGRAIPVSCTVGNNVYTIEQKALNAFRLLAERRKPPEKLIEIMQKMSRIFAQNLIGFLQTFLDEQRNILREFDRIKCQFSSMDTRDTYRRLLDKIRGCSHVCPCCHRPCDVDHTQIKSQPGSRDNEHRCTTGHALRAMNGYKFEVTNEASLWTCEQIQDDQILIIENKRYSWLEFKLNHPHWKFESDFDPVHGKFLLVWQKIGRILCQKYNMKYVTDNVASCYVHQAFDYILILDGSASMHGNRWQDSIRAVQQFLSFREALKTEDRITIIVFSQSARIVQLHEKIDQIDINRIKHIDQQADFATAFDTVKVCIDHSRNTTTIGKSLDYAIIFISNGQGVYPKQELEDLSREHRSVIKQFWTLSMNEDPQSPASEVLEKITKKMNGSFYDVPTSTDVIKAYAEIAGKHVR